ncbi:unnamed protein product [Miscanthus lutarioriparius]|uniref:Thaumatin-like protein n=1 Tax=Miscanthus lutarioriparius TaxID=422564 RepID=A0A811RTY3_9POAL|nr:unnamed protein product [Miscanthus lutarioriparius]
MTVASGWSGRVWGRTLCSTNAGTGKFTCVTGDCGSGKQDCAGGRPAPPATLAQFTLDGSGGTDSYGVSLVDGFNLPVLVAPQQGASPGGNCALAECEVDLNAACPAGLRVTSGTSAVACKSACQAFGSPQYCCTGEYGNPDKCKPSSYSQFFKKACPRSYSYAYDGADSIFTCGSGGGGTCAYTIVFCPSTPSSAKLSTSPNSQPPGTGKPAVHQRHHAIHRRQPGRRY